MRALSHARAVEAIQHAGQADHATGHILLPHAAQEHGGGEAGRAANPLAIGVVGGQRGRSERHTFSASMVLMLVACAAGGQGTPSPRHPGPGATAPWNPNLMSSHCKRSDAHSSGQMCVASNHPGLGTTKSCAKAAQRPTPRNAGGLGRLARPHPCLTAGRSACR